MSNTNLILGDCLSEMVAIPDNSVDLVLMDPPYVGMVNESWDRMSSLQASEFFSSLMNRVYRVLRYGGRLVCFCSNDTLKYLYKYSKLLHRELLIIDKDVKQVSAGRNTRNYKQHINHCEYVFVSTKYAREHVREILLKQSRKDKKSSKEINKLLGVAEGGGGMWSIYTGENKCNQVPTRDMWSRFEGIFPGLPGYETFEETFQNGLGKGNVLRGYSFKIKDRKHPTQKPLPLLEYLIETYSREEDVILDPTMGSGSTGIACLNTGRNFIGIEKDGKYFELAKDRIAAHEFSTTDGTP